METIVQIIRTRRETLGLLLRQVARYLDIDHAVLWKIEGNRRKPTKENIIQLAEILKFEKKGMLIQLMSDKIVYEIADEDCVDRVLKIAEKKVKYFKTHPIKN